MPVVLNLTNHPVSTWPDAQRDAAGAELGHLHEVPGGMPLVPPTATSAEVAAMADDLVARALAVGAEVAVVAGEPTLTFALVHRLLAAGIRCVAPTTHRNASESHDAHGVVHRSSAYRFVAFRPYSR